MIAPDDDGAAVTLDDLVDWCESSAFDPSCEDGLAAAAPMLRALSRNRDFLATCAMEELKTRCAGQRRFNPYSAQVMLLRPPTGKYVLRAAFWPAMHDHVVRMNGAASFLYNVPHDHGFDFLTIGYLGPGYMSDYYDYDPARVAGVDGERVALRFLERGQLTQGRMLLYRANRDIHAQLPPPALSVSLNILASVPGQGWRRQFRFDTAQQRIDACMTVASAQLLLELAVASGHADARDLAEDFADRHPVDAMRATAWRAIDAGLSGAERLAHRERGARSCSPLVSRAAATLLGNIHYGYEMACFPPDQSVG
nr:transposase [Sphingobium sp. OAS761]